jgi:Bacterial Ig domain
MVRHLSAILYHGIKLFGDRSNAVFRRSYHSLCRLLYFQCRELRSALQHRAGAVFGVTAASGLLLAFAGCGGDGGGSNVPELGGPAPVERHEPVARDLTITTNQDTPVILKVLADDRDAHGDLLSVVSVVQPRHGTVSINPDNTVTYTPETRFSGTDTFAYTIFYPGPPRVSLPDVRTCSHRRCGVSNPVAELCNPYRWGSLPLGYDHAWPDPGVDDPVLREG